MYIKGWYSFHLIKSVWRSRKRETQSYRKIHVSSLTPLLFMYSSALRHWALFLSGTTTCLPFIYIYNVFGEAGAMWVLAIFQRNLVVVKSCFEGVFSWADINLRLVNIGSDCRFVHYATCLARTIKGTGFVFLQLQPSELALRVSFRILPLCCLIKLRMLLVQL